VFLYEKENEINIEVVENLEKKCFIRNCVIFMEKKEKQGKVRKE